MKYKWLMLVILTILVSCTGVSVYRHPDYNFAPTDPNLIKVYLPGQDPLSKYIIIGQIAIDASWTIDTAGGERKVAQRAASVGADGVVISDVQVDIYAFNQYVAVHGYTSPGQFSMFITPHAAYYKQIIITGYLIKWI